MSSEISFDQKKKERICFGSMETNYNSEKQFQMDIIAVVERNQRMTKIKAELFRKCTHFMLFWFSALRLSSSLFQ